MLTSHLTPTEDIFNWDEVEWSLRILLNTAIHLVTTNRFQMTLKIKHISILDNLILSFWKNFSPPFRHSWHYATFTCHIFCHLRIFSIFFPLLLSQYLFLLQTTFSSWCYNPPWDISLQATALSLLVIICLPVLLLHSTVIRTCPVSVSSQPGPLWVHIWQIWFHQGAHAQPHPTTH